MTDLIERDEALRLIAEEQAKAKYGMEDCALYRASKIVKELPAVNAKPIRRGRWIENRTDLICSACKWEYSDELRFMSHHGLDAIEEAFAYCPHCGARMDGYAE